MTPHGNYIGLVVSYSRCGLIDQIPWLPLILAIDLGPGSTSTLFSYRYSLYIPRLVELSPWNAYYDHVIPLHAQSWRE